MWIRAWVKRGEGSAMLAKAEKEAEANRRLAESLTPNLLQYTLINKLAANVHVILMPAGQNLILDSGILKIPEQQKK